MRYYAFILALASVRACIDLFMREPGNLKVEGCERVDRVLEYKRAGCVGGCEIEVTDVPWILSFGLAVRYLCFVSLLGSHRALKMDSIVQTS